MTKNKEVETIGQRICAAVLSCQLGISFERAMKLYVRGREIAPQWEEAGEALLKRAPESASVPGSLRRLGPEIVRRKAGNKLAR